MEKNVPQDRFSQPMQEEVIDLRQYWMTIYRHKWGILGFAIIISILSTLVAFSMKPVYQATATLLIEAKQANVVSIEQVYGLDTNNDEYYQTQFEILRSRQLAEKVIDKLNLIDHPEFNPEPSAFSFNWRDWLPVARPKESKTEEEEKKIKLQQLTQSFIRKLTISPVRKTQLVQITFAANNPLLAAQVANAVGNAYIENNLDARMQLTYKASEWLMERLSGLREQVNTSEEKLQEYRNKEQIVGSDGGAEIANNELSLISTRLVDARRTRLEAESLYRQIQSVSSSNLEAYENIPVILNHPLIRDLKRAELETALKKADLAKRYGPKHPQMQAVESELSDVRGALYNQIKRIVSSIESDYRIALTNERSLKADQENAKQKLQAINNKDHKLKSLEKEAESTRKLYDTFFNRLNETNATGDLQSANARISDPAEVPIRPAKPNKKLIIALSFIASVMFGVVLAFLMEALNNTVKSATDVENKLNSTMLGLLPLLTRKKGKEDQSYTAYIDDPKSPYAESVRTIRTGVVLSALDNPHKILCCTSSVPGEGKTSLAINLATSIGQMEKVLLIDADMRRPSIAKAFGLSSKVTGLSNLVAGTSKLEECIHRSDTNNIDIMTAGTIPPNPLDLLASKRFAKVLSVLESHYDRIVIDTAPTQAVSDALVLAQHVGAMIYVVKADATNHQQAKAGLKRLKEVNAPLIGVVLNQVDIKKASKYYSDDYQGYYDTYGYVDEATEDDQIKSPA
ncbi:polysaccharide biosynthesis tyrosine autokinase [uncultured Amphritea sp.]|uniref:GumC family protein n=1 Tax=uncultured Amphritea sp. TaxID=981605 RepID=UPI00261F7B8D|nr:polysaccharide biosynthesis tyrosine autokinase [uncultured Amphritea sp.]